MDKRKQIVDCKRLHDIALQVEFTGDVAGTILNMATYINEREAWNEIKICNDSLPIAVEFLQKLSMSLEAAQHQQTKQLGEI